MNGEQGRPLEFNSPEEVYQAFEDYKKWCDKNPIIQEVSHVKNGVQNIKHKRCLSLGGFCGFCGIVTNTFRNCKAREGFLNICTRIEEEIDEDWNVHGAVGVYNASLTAMRLGLKEKREEQKEAIKIEIVSRSNNSALKDIIDED